MSIWYAQIQTAVIYRVTALKEHFLLKHFNNYVCTWTYNKIKERTLFLHGITRAYSFPISSIHLAFSPATSSPCHKCDDFTTLLDNVNLVDWIASTFWYILHRMVWIYPSGFCHKLLVGAYGSQFLHLTYLYHKVWTFKRYLTQLLVSLSSHFAIFCP